MELHPHKKMTGGLKNSGRARESIPGFPLISVITTVFNEQHEIERVIDEVQRQTYTNKEHIIIDGVSDDGTLDVLIKRDGDVDYWISEPDAGIYDAMNKGIDAAGGEWVYFLGADDCFYRSDILADVFQNRDIPADVDLMLGNILYPDGRLFRSRFDKKLYFKNTIHHQSAFYRRRVFEKFRYGLHRTSASKKQLAISGDYQLNLMLFTQGMHHIYVNETIARCGSGISLEGRFAGYLEEIMIRHQYMNFFRAIIFDITTILRYGLKHTRSL